MGSTASLEGQAVLITGANRGLGQALVEEALHRGAARVYAASRTPFVHQDRRVTPLTLDVTNEAQIEAAAEQVETLDLLINNAAVAIYDDLTDRSVIQQHLDVNLFGSWGMIQAFLPPLVQSRGAIVNVLSDSAFAALPIVPGYSISKAAAFSMSQAVRALVAARGISVHAVIPGPIDTDMSRDFPVPKASPESVAQAIYDGVANGDEEIFPDPQSQNLAESWRQSASKQLERTYAATVQAEPLAP
jgi:NAD(P)-dependent dehydrogenase (short-subunit alcohol dehydrogenase family)